MAKTLYIIRGIPGAGKTTLGLNLTQYCVAADDFMVNRQGEYEFIPSRLKECHEKCFNQVRELLSRGRETVAVTNTFKAEWEYMRYIFLGLAYGYNVIGIDVSSSNKSVHGLSGADVLRFEASFQHNINNAIAMATTIMEGRPYEEPIASDDWFVDRVNALYGEG